MHVDMHRLAFISLERRVRTLETQVRMWTEHAFRDGCCERVGDDIWEDEGRVHNGVLLNVPCAEAEVVVCCCAVVEGLCFGHHAGV